MSALDPLELQPPGTLPTPGLIGRGVRLAAGAACLYALFELLRYREAIVAAPVSQLKNLLLLLLAPVVALNSMINIGFSRNWGKWPLRASVIGLLLVAVISWLATRQIDNVWFGNALWFWLVYCYAHLGLSFILSAIAATPGCEMRAVPDLLGRVLGRPAREHHCPAFLDKVDRWEARKKSAGDS